MGGRWHRVTYFLLSGCRVMTSSVLKAKTAACKVSFVICSAPEVKGFFLPQNGTAASLPWSTRIWNQTASAHKSTATRLSSHHYHSDTATRSCLRWVKVSWESYGYDLSFLSGLNCYKHFIHTRNTDLDSLWWGSADGVRNLKWIFSNFLTAASTQWGTFDFIQDCSLKSSDHFSDPYFRFFY